MSQSGTNSPDAPRQPREIAIAYLGTCRSITATAEKCGVGRRTIHRWLQDPDFALAVEDRKREFVAEQLTRFRGLVPLALKRLKAIMCDPETPAASIRACLATLKAAGMLREERPPKSKHAPQTIVFGTLKVAEGKIIAEPPAELAAPVKNDADPQPRPSAADGSPPPEGRA